MPTIKPTQSPLPSAKPPRSEAARLQPETSAGTPAASRGGWVKKHEAAQPHRDQFQRQGPKSAVAQHQSPTKKAPSAKQLLDRWAMLHEEIAPAPAKPSPITARAREMAAKLKTADPASAITARDCQDLFDDAVAYAKAQPFFEALSTMGFGPSEAAVAMRALRSYDETVRTDGTAVALVKGSPSSLAQREQVAALTKVTEKVLAGKTIDEFLRSPPPGLEAVAATLKQLPGKAGRLEILCATLDAQLASFMTDQPTQLVDDAQLLQPALEAQIMARTAWLGQKGTDPGALSIYCSNDAGWDELSLLRELTVLAPARAAELGSDFTKALKKAIGQADQQPIGDR